MVSAIQHFVLRPTGWFESHHIRIFVNCSFEWHRISPSYADPRSELIAITGPVLGPIQPHIRSPLSRGYTIIPHSTGTGSGERDQTQDRHLSAKRIPGPFTPSKRHLDMRRERPSASNRWQLSGATCKAREVCKGVVLAPSVCTTNVVLASMSM